MVWSICAASVWLHIGREFVCQLFDLVHNSRVAILFFSSNNSLIIINLVLLTGLTDVQVFVLSVSATVLITVMLTLSSSCAVELSTLMSGLGRSAPMVFAAAFSAVPTDVKITVIYVI